MEVIMELILVAFVFGTILRSAWKDTDFYD